MKGEIKNFYRKLEVEDHNEQKPDYVIAAIFGAFVFVCALFIVAAIHHG